MKPILVPSCSPVPPSPHLWARPKAQPPRQRRQAARTGPAPIQGPHPAGHGRHPARSNGNTPLPGEEGQVPGGCQGVAAGWLRAGRAALQSLPGGRGGLQHHTGHAVVRVAGRLSLTAVRRWTQAQWGKRWIEKASYWLCALCSSVDTEALA